MLTQPPTVTAHPCLSASVEHYPVSVKGQLAVGLSWMDEWQLKEAEHETGHLNRLRLKSILSLPLNPCDFQPEDFGEFGSPHF